MNKAGNFLNVLVNMMANASTRQEDSVIVVATWLFASSSSTSLSISTVTDLGDARIACVKEEPWQSFGRGLA